RTSSSPGACARTKTRSLQTSFSRREKVTDAAKRWPADEGGRGAAALHVQSRRGDFSRSGLHCSPQRGSATRAPPAPTKEFATFRSSDRDARKARLEGRALLGSVAGRTREVLLSRPD